MENVEVLHLVLARLEAEDLARASCCSRLWREVGASEHLWRALSQARWPGCSRGEPAILGMGGYRAFYTRRALTMMRLPSHKPWLRLDHLTFFVDLTYRGLPVVSEALPGPAAATGRAGRPHFGLRIDPGVLTESVLPRRALTPLFYQGQLFYEKPFQAIHASHYRLTWSAVRSTDNRVASLLHCTPQVDAEIPWERGLSGTGAHSCLPMVFRADLGGGAACGCGGEPYRIVTGGGGGGSGGSLMAAFGFLNCEPVWGRSLDHPMRFKLVELRLGARWKRSDDFEPPLDSILLALQQLDWK